MGKFLKKVTLPLVGAGLIGSLAFFAVAQAKDLGSEDVSKDAVTTQTAASAGQGQSADQNGEQENKDKGVQAQSDEEELGQVEAQAQKEGNVKKDINQDVTVLGQVDIPEVDNASLKTYGDVIDFLKGLQARIADVKAAVAAGSQPDAALTADEKNLLVTLAGKHEGILADSGSRIDELNGVIQDLIDALTPISSQTISETSGLRKLLVSEAKNLRDRVNELKDLGGLNLDALRTEIE